MAQVMANILSTQPNPKCGKLWDPTQPFKVGLFDLFCCGLRWLHRLRWLLLQNAMYQCSQTEVWEELKKKQKLSLQVKDLILLEMVIQNQYLRNVQVLLGLLDL